MKQYEGKLVGILGTIIIHLVAGIFFVSLKLSSVYIENRTEFLVEFQSERDFIQEELIEVPRTLEELFENDDRFKDIVRNIANDDVADIDPMEYQDRVKEELIASGLLEEENFIDEQKKSIDEMDLGDTSLDVSDEKPDTINNDISANEMAAMYQGPTRIFYSLENRYHMELPIPIYKCENSGVIVFNIVVDQNGRITDFSLNESESTTSDRCLYEAAAGTIRRTLFNPDNGSPRRQAGSITYQFVEQ